jgi:hypothetical protein
MPIDLATKDQVDAKKSEILEKIKDTLIEYYEDNIWDGDMENAVECSDFDEEDNALIDDILDEIEEVKFSINFIPKIVNKKTEIINELEGYVGDDAELAFEWCEDHKQALIQEGKGIVEKWGDNYAQLFDPSGWSPSDMAMEDLDEQLFDFQAEFLSPVGYSGPSEEHNLKCCAAVWIQHNKDLILTPSNS